MRIPLNLSKVYEPSYTYLTNYKDYFWGTGDLVELKKEIVTKLPEDLRNKLRYVVYKPTNEPLVLSYNPVEFPVDQKDWKLYDKE